MPERTASPSASAAHLPAGEIEEATRCFEQIHSAWWEMERAEYRTSWTPAGPHTQGKYVFTALSKSSELWSVSGHDPLAVVVELRNQLGLPAC